MHLYVQTVFEGAQANTYEAGLRDLYKFNLNGPYGFDVRKDSSVPTMGIFHTGGTPWTVILSPRGEAVYSDHPWTEHTLKEIIDAQLALMLAQQGQAL